MCLFCVEVAKQTMTPLEVARAYRELSYDDWHLGKILNVINDNYDIDQLEDFLCYLNEEEE